MKGDDKIFWDGGVYTNGWLNDSFRDWCLRLILTKLDDAGLIYLRIGQRFRFRDILGSNNEYNN